MILSSTFNCIFKDNLNHGIEKIDEESARTIESTEFLPPHGWHKVGDTTIDPLLDFIGNDVLSD